MGYFCKKLTFIQNLCYTASYPLALVKSYNVNVNITTIFPPMQLILFFLNKYVKPFTFNIINSPSEPYGLHAVIKK